MTDIEYERCMDVLRSIHAEHNWRHYTTKAGILRHPQCVEVRYRGDLSTFDGDELTRLVVAAHRFRVRVGISGRCRYVMTVFLHPRDDHGSSTARHPGLESLSARAEAGR
jgi:hypothetical protein